MVVGNEEGGRSGTVIQAKTIVFRGPMTKSKQGRCDNGENKME